MSLNNATGLIGTVVTTGFTLGALGLTLNFVDRAFDRATPRGNRRSRGPVFDTKLPKNQNIYGLPQAKRRRNGNNKAFNTELFNF